MNRRSIKQQVREYLARKQPAAINEAEWLELKGELAPVSESYLRELLRDTGLPFAQPYAGIRQHSFAELEQTLLEMLDAYSAATGSGDRQRARYCRRQVISAKDRARFLAGRSPEKRAQKEEMAQWMLVWLEDPAMFPAWVDIRKRHMSAG